MEAALIILTAIVVVGAVLYVHHRLTSSGSATDGSVATTAGNEDEPSGECCGMHVTCEKDSLLSSMSDDIVYYDDEELDTFAGRDSDSYSEREIEQFRDVLLTLLPEDIAGWGRSIQLRGITLPEAVRDELIMIVSEARAKKAVTSYA